MVDKERLVERIEEHETWLEYHLDSWEAAKRAGSRVAAESSLGLAAKHAAILTALRSLSTPLMKDEVDD